MVRSQLGRTQISEDFAVARRMAAAAESLRRQCWRGTGWRRFFVLVAVRSLGDVVDERCLAHFFWALPRLFDGRRRHGRLGRRADHEGGPGVPTDARCLGGHCCGGNCERAGCKT